MPDRVVGNTLSIFARIRNTAIWARVTGWFGQYADWGSLVLLHPLVIPRRAITSMYRINWALVTPAMFKDGTAPRNGFRMEPPPAPRSANVLAGSAAAALWAQAGRISAGGAQVIGDLSLVHERFDDPVGHLRAGDDRVGSKVRATQVAGARIGQRARSRRRQDRRQAVIDGAGAGGRRNCQTEVLGELNPGEEAAVGRTRRLHILEVGVVVAVGVGSREAQGVVGD